MLDKDLRGCICTVHSYRSGGGSFGGNGSSQWFYCRSCGRPCLVISHYMTVLLFPTEVVLEPVPEEDRWDGKAERVSFPQEGLDYVNGALDITMRAYGAAVEVAREAADKMDWALRCELLGIPRGSKIEFRKTEPRGRCMVRPDGTEVEDPTILEKFDKLCDISRAYNAHNRQFLAPPTPPKIPACLTAFVYDGREREEERWRSIDHAESAALCVPPDPRRTAHDERFSKIFTELRAVAPAITLVEIPNQYHDDKNKSQPWYTFQYHGCKLTVGPRKSVISITIESEKPLPTGGLRSLAKRDSVTYEADDQWQSGAETARKITIHAWSDGKCFEYLSQALLDIDLAPVLLASLPATEDRNTP